VFWLPHVVQKQWYVGWGGNLNNCLMASCIRNSCTKNYYNLIIRFQVMMDKFWCVFYAWQCTSARTLKQQILLVLGYPAYIGDPAYIMDPAFIWDPAAIKTSDSDPRLVLETRPLYETRLVLAVLRYMRSKLTSIGTESQMVDKWL